MGLTESQRNEPHIARPRLISIEEMTKYNEMQNAIFRDFPELSSTMWRRLMSFVINICPNCYQNSKPCDCLNEEK